MHNNAASTEHESPQPSADSGSTGSVDEHPAPKLKAPAASSRMRRWRRARYYAFETIKDRQSLLPLIGALLGGLLGALLTNLGTMPDPEKWTITVGSARAGLLSGLSILFAGLSIVLALASVTIQNVVGRFSLRMVRIYLRDAGDQIVIAVFVLAATYNLVYWYGLRGLPGDAFAPPIGVIAAAVLLFVSGGSMIWYLGALSSWFRIDAILQRVGRAVIGAAWKVARQHSDDSPVTMSGLTASSDAMPIHAQTSGYLTDVDTQGLLDLARRYDGAFVLERGIGSSVVQGEPIGWFTHNAPTQSADTVADTVADLIHIDGERAMDREASYGLCILVDIAIMALSPAVNDPNTAAQVIEEMTMLLPKLAQIQTGSYGRVDEGGRLRVAVPALSFGDYVELATAQIVLYAGKDPVVVAALVRLAHLLSQLDLHEDDRRAVQTLATKVNALQS